MMEHKDLTEQIMMLVSGELNETESRKLLEHIDSCELCGKEYRFQIQMMADFQSANPEFNIDKLLVDSRRELRRTIHALPDKVSFSDRIKAFFRSPFAIPSLTGAGGLAVGLVAGFLLLGGTSKHQDSFLTNVSDKGDQQTRITNVMFNDRDTKDGNITFTFDAYKRITVSGSPDDPGIQKLLTYSILNEKNPGTRLNSINLVNNRYDKNQLTGVKEALILAAKNDENPGVRLQALKTLADLPFDDGIKKTLLHVLVNDNTPGNRIEAINTLVKAIENGFKADDEIKTVFKTRLDQEENPYIKIRAKTILDAKEL